MEYYVKTNGNNLNDGLSLANAFASITKGVQVVQPGDTLYIMPGLYSELVALVTSGTSLNRIKIVCCNNGIDLSTGNVIDTTYKGNVSLSFVDKNGNETLASSRFDFNAKSYVDLYGMTCISKANSFTLSGTNCNIYYSHANNVGNTTNTRGYFGNSATYLTDNNNCYSCTSRGTYRGFEYISNIWHSKGDNAAIGYSNCGNIYYSSSLSPVGFTRADNCVNCVGYNNSVTFSNNAGTNNFYNCLSVNSATSWINQTNSITNLNNCYSINCNTVITVTGAVNNTNVNKLYYQGNFQLIVGTAITGIANLLTTFWDCVDFNENDYKAIIPRNTIEDTTQLDYSAVRDILNQPVKLIDNIVKAGNEQRSIKEYVSKDEIKILRRGVHSIKPRLEAGNYTASCFV